MFWKNVLIGFTLVVSMASAKDYAGAELYSKESFKYGKFEARMFMGAGSGVVSSMFLYYDDSLRGGEDPWREVDIEVLGKSPEGFQTNIITGNASKKIMSEDHHDLPTPANKAYQTYAMEWTPDYIAWLVDGKEVRRSTDQQVIDCRDSEQSLRFNLWVANIVSWVGQFDESILPVYQYIDWIQFSSYDEDTKEFSLDWRDDFDEEDLDSRWGTANWTFAENEVDFEPDNVVIKQGKLILSLTKPPMLGHEGEVPQDNGETTAVVSQVQLEKLTWNQWQEKPLGKTWKGVQVVNSKGEVYSNIQVQEQGSKFRILNLGKVPKGNWFFYLP